MTVPPNHPSARVRLEAELLDTGAAAPPPAPPADERRRLTVLVFAADTDVRRYVRECLRDRPHVGVEEVATLGELRAALARLAD